MSRSLLKLKEKNKYFIKFNMDGLLQGSYESRMRGYRIVRQNGWMSANDIRELEQMDKIPSEQSGDLYLVNDNMLPLNKAGTFYDDEDKSSQSDTNIQTETVGKGKTDGQEETNESTDSKEVL